jgi:hypothetical protein
LRQEKNMPHNRFLTCALISGAVLLAALGLSGEPARAQMEAQPLRVEEAVTGELTTEAPNVLYSFYAVESTRMGIVFDQLDGDMQLGIVVFDQDGEHVLAGATGPAINGLVVKFPSQGQYFLGLGPQEGGTSATYRLMIDADPAQPINPFVSQSYLVAGPETACADNTLTTAFTTTEDLNVCFALDLINKQIDLKIEWWTPSGEVFNSEGGPIDDTYNRQLLLTGLVVSADTPFEEGWWQVHFLLNDELVHIQWVPVVAAE